MGTRPEEQISKLLGLIGQPVRIQIMLIIGTHEACVCHLEVALEVRQASISQHLMVLRKAGLVCTRRDGRNVFYQAARPEVLDLLQQAARIAGINPEDLLPLTVLPLPGCPCPACNPGLDPELSCQHYTPPRSASS